MKRDATCLVDAIRHGRRDLTEMHVARSEIGCGVGDRDVRASGEGIRGQSATHPGAVNVGVSVVSAIPLRASQFAHAHETLSWRAFSHSSCRRVWCESPPPWPLHGYSRTSLGPAHALKAA